MIKFEQTAQNNLCSIFILLSLNRKKENNYSLLDFSPQGFQLFLLCDMKLGVNKEDSTQRSYLSLLLKFFSNKKI